MTVDDDDRRRPPGVTAAGQVAGETSQRMDLEVVSAVILAVVTIITAWSAFQATKWGGVMSIRFSEAGAARTQATQAAGRADVERAIDVGLFTQYVAAVAEDRTELANFIEQRFRDEFAPAFDAWAALEPLTNPAAPSSPFVMEEYVIDEAVAAAELDATADRRAQQARDANQTGDNYVLLTVLFAAVLFFAGVSTKFETVGVQVGLLVVAVVLLLTGLTFAARFPVEI